MKWGKVKLEDLCTRITSGGTPNSKTRSYYEPPTIPWLTTGEVNYSRIYNTSKFISEEGLRNSSAKIIEPNSVIVAMYGQGDTAGRVAINKVPLTTNQACCNMTLDGNLADYRFVYYSLCIKYNEIVALKTGGAQPNLNARKLREFEIEVPDLLAQRRISDILETYDDLIDNCQKQIALLEEAAQRLYKEWFVDFRFPGHESIAIVDGLPDGWHKHSISDLGVELESGGRPKGGVKDLVCGIPSIGAENVIGLGKYNFSSEKLVPEEYFNSMKRGFLKDRDILIYKDGAYIGRTSLFQDNFPHAKAAVNEHVFLLRTKNPTYQYFLFFTLYQQSYFELMQGLNANAAQPGLNQSNILGIPITIPQIKIVEKFNDYVSPIMTNIFLNANQIKKLISARDLLLPRLMSSKIEIKI